MAFTLDALAGPLVGERLGELRDGALARRRRPGTRMPPWKLSSEAMEMILPGALRAIMSRPASCESWKTAVSLIWMTFSQSASGNVDGVLAENDAGVVDQDVDAAELGEDLLEERFGSGGVGEVGS